MSIKLSVVIPTYREAHNLEAVARTIGAALSWQRWAFEIIFVDDDSRDGSEELARKLADQLPVRMIVRHGEKGLSTAVLRGISEALRLDDDGGDLAAPAAGAAVGRRA